MAARTAPSQEFPRRLRAALRVGRWVALACAGACLVGGLVLSMVAPPPARRAAAPQSVRVAGNASGPEPIGWTLQELPRGPEGARISAGFMGGVRVLGVARESLAARAGVKAGDVIVRAGATPADGIEAVAQAVGYRDAEKLARRGVTLGLVRGGEVVTVILE